MTLPTKSAASFEAQDVPWLWAGRIPLGMVSAVQGEQGLGKSTVLARLAAEVSCGSLDGAMAGTPKGVILISMEDSPGHVIRPRLEAARADLERVHLADSGTDKWWTVKAGAADLEATIRAHDAALVVIDPIMAHLGDGTDSHKDASVRTELCRLAEIAQRTGAAIVFVLHLRKSAGDALGRASGSVAFTALPRSVLALGRSRVDDSRLVLAHAKCNVGPKLKSLALRVVSRGKTSAIEWLGESHETADDICAVRDGTANKRAPQRERAEAFLRARLSNGPVPSEAILAQARDEKIGKNTVYLAAAALKVIKRKNGDGPWT